SLGAASSAQLANKRSAQCGRRSPAARGDSDRALSNESMASSIGDARRPGSSGRRLSADAPERNAGFQSLGNNPARAGTLEDALGAAGAIYGFSVSGSLSEPRGRRESSPLRNGVDDRGPRRSGERGSHELVSSDDDLAL